MKRRNKNSCEFRIESSRPLSSSLCPMPMGMEFELNDRSLAVVMATKTHTVPCGGEIRVVHTPTGEVIFRKQDECWGGRYQG